MERKLYILGRLGEKVKGTFGVQAEQIMAYLAESGEQELIKMECDEGYYRYKIEEAVETIGEERKTEDEIEEAL